ncbi:hypothetical protein [Streptomyces sp. NPDC051997]|uniref:hypothetical protein n=1 Tax=Streptomyces sp. NPDC051997 TaxID=3155611 RepID=UPI00342E5BD8
MTHTISTTMQPDKVIEVEDAEYTDLTRQGLVLIDYSAQAAATAPATTNKAAKPATTKEG